jgi:hypothetical protein
VHTTGGHLPVKRPLIGAVRDTLVSPGCSDAVDRLLRQHFKLPTSSIHQQHTQHCSRYGTQQLMPTHNFISTAAQLLMMTTAHTGDAGTRGPHHQNFTKPAANQQAATAARRPSSCPSAPLPLPHPPPQHPPPPPLSAAAAAAPPTASPNALLLSPPDA